MQACRHHSRQTSWVSVRGLLYAKLANRAPRAIVPPPRAFQKTTCHAASIDIGPKRSTSRKSVEHAQLGLSQSILAIFGHLALQPSPKRVECRHKQWKVQSESNLCSTKTSADFSTAPRITRHGQSGLFGLDPDTDHADAVAGSQESMTAGQVSQKLMAEATEGSCMAVSAFSRIRPASTLLTGGTSGSRGRKRKP